MRGGAEYGDLRWPGPDPLRGTQKRDAHGADAGRPDSGIRARPVAANERRWNPVCGSWRIDGGLERIYDIRSGIGDRCSATQKLQLGSNQPWACRFRTIGRAGPQPGASGAELSIWRPHPNRSCSLRSAIPQQSSPRSVTAECCYSRERNWRGVGKSRG